MDLDLDTFGILGLIVLAIMLILLSPLIDFWICYFGGWLAKIFVGDKLAAALNILFNTTYFTKNMLPMMAGALGWIGGFFKNVNFANRKRKGE